MAEPFLRGTKPKRQHVTPSIDLSGSVGRSWKNVPARLIEVGDIIPDFGKVESGMYSTDGEFNENVRVRLKSVTGTYKIFDAEEIVFVFTH